MYVPPKSAQTPTRSPLRHSQRCTSSATPTCSHNSGLSSRPLAPRSPTQPRTQDSFSSCPASVQSSPRPSASTSRSSSPSAPRTRMPCSAGTGFPKRSSACGTATCRIWTSSSGTPRADSTPSVSSGLSGSWLRREIRRAGRSGPRQEPRRVVVGAGRRKIGRGRSALPLRGWTGRGCPMVVSFLSLVSSLIYWDLIGG